MPANIDSMMYVGETPWHNLGIKLDNIATAEEAIKAAGLDWEVEKRPVYIQDPSGEFKIVAGNHAVVRKDRGITLGVVGDRFEPLQNKDAFKFFDAVVGIKAAIYHTAGSLGVGRRVWILAKLNGIVKVTSRDEVEKYLLLANGHDGTLSAQMMFTPIRVVCQNTLNEAMQNSSLRYTMRHTSSIGGRVRDVQDALGIVNSRFEVFELAAQRLTSIKTSDQEFKTYLQGLGLAPKPPTPQEALISDRSTARLTAIEEVLNDLRQSGKGTDLPSVRGTAWGDYNAVVEYADYAAKTRGTAENRAKSLLFGPMADLKARAWSALTPA
jgi:phage/plasmid-like protein (TIGR03299 family)